MRVEKLMTRQVVCCQQKDSLARAAQLMWNGDCGCLPVEDDQGSVVGMITLADLACEATREQNLQSPSIRGSEISVTLASICRPARSGLAT